jgi:uncharacterized protein YjdB
MRPSRSLLALLVLAVACGSTGAGPSDDGGGVATITITPDTGSIVLGQSLTLTAVARDAGGRVLSGRAFSWVSGTPTIATVANGVVTSVNPGGPVTIIASTEGRSGFAEFRVIQPAVASIDLSPTVATLQVGQTLQVVATPRDAGGNAIPINVTTWSTNNNQVATITSSGLVTATGVGGPVNIRAFAGTVSATMTVTVTAGP